MRRRRWLLLPAALLLLVALAVALRWGDDDGGQAQRPASPREEPPATTSRSNPAAGDGTARVVEDLLARRPEEAVATGTGVIRTYEDDPEADAVAEILAVEAGEASTVLRWRVRTTQGVVRVHPNTFRERAGGTDLADVVLVDSTSATLAKPFRFKTGYGTRCVCSAVPRVLDDEGQVLTGLYPPLPGGARTVEVRIPGFAAITDVPITRD